MSSDAHSLPSTRSHVPTLPGACAHRPVPPSRRALISGSPDPPHPLGPLVHCPGPRRRLKLQAGAGGAPARQVLWGSSPWEDGSHPRCSDCGLEFGVLFGHLKGTLCGWVWLLEARVKSQRPRFWVSASVPRVRNSMTGVPLVRAAESGQRLIPGRPIPEDRGALEPPWSGKTAWPDLLSSRGFPAPRLWCTRAAASTGQRKTCLQEPSALQPDPDGDSQSCSLPRASAPSALALYLLPL